MIITCIVCAYCAYQMDARAHDATEGNTSIFLCVYSNAINFIRAYKFVYVEPTHRRHTCSALMHKRNTHALVCINAYPSVWNHSNKKMNKWRNRAQLHIKVTNNEHRAKQQAILLLYCPPAVQSFLHTKFISAYRPTTRNETSETRQTLINGIRWLFFDDEIFDWFSYGWLSLVWLSIEYSWSWASRRKEEIKEVPHDWWLSQSLLTKHSIVAKDMLNEAMFGWALKVETGKNWFLPGHQWRRRRVNTEHLACSH